MRVKKTNKDLISFINNTNAVLSVSSENKGAKILTKQAKVFSSALEDYNASIENNQIEYCSVDEKNNVMKGEKGEYLFTKEALKELSIKTKELLNQEVEVEVFLTAEQVNLLPQGTQDYFNSFLGLDSMGEQQAEVVELGAITKQESILGNEIN